MYSSTAGGPCATTPAGGYTSGLPPRRSVVRAGMVPTVRGTEESRFDCRSRSTKLSSAHSCCGKVASELLESQSDSRARKLATERGSSCRAFAESSSRRSRESAPSVCGRNEISLETRYKSTNRSSELMSSGRPVSWLQPMPSSSRRTSRSTGAGRVRNRLLSSRSRRSF